MEIQRSNPDATAAPPGYYVWEVPGKPVQIQMDLDVVDRMLLEVMRGFGMVPKRGAEVGGLLLGTSEYTDKLVVRIEDFEPVACEYKNGPSYVLSGPDRVGLREALERWKATPDKRVFVVGYYRSHTRDGLFLAAEDVDLINEHFADPSQIYLLVKPFATRVSVAGFFFQEDGEIHGESTFKEFPFRRRELVAAGALPGPAPAAIPPPPPPPTASERGKPRLFESDIPAPPPSSAAGRPGPEGDPSVPPFLSTGGGRGSRRGAPPADSIPEPSSAPSLSSPTFAGPVDSPGSLPARPGHVYWAPLSVVFLALGLLLGFVAALLLHKPEKDPPGDPYALGLSVVRNGENLELTWDPRIPAVRRALRGTLVITDGDRTTPRQLSPQELEVGKAVYRRTSNNIVFLLQVFTAENTSLSEKTELHLAGGSAAAAPGGSGQEPAAEEPPSTARRRRGRR